MEDYLTAALPKEKEEGSKIYALYQRDAEADNRLMDLVNYNDMLLLAKPYVGPPSSIGQHRGVLFYIMGLRCKGYPLIEYEKFEEAQAVISVMKGIELLTQIIMVDWASNNGPFKQMNMRKRYVNDVIKEGIGVSVCRKESTGEDGKRTVYWYDRDSTIGHRLYKEITKVEFMKMKGKERLRQPTNSYQWETLATNLKEFKQIFVAREEAWARVFSLELD
ncbi:hypothetical protein GIB67_027851 [Kingdonia uniflora]|uniref:Uncharacterized protein n=1 Tax=Kingdonia uniflora TaxID=39325 RepID=A0A7J7P4W7_9MAGN|nr:hypothetical protein GIB67_027851 [Kingdonia uniflora]